jgi:hypothetical protein
MGEKLSANDEFENEVQRDVVLERGEQIDDKWVLLGRDSRASRRRDNARVTLISERIFRSAMMCSLCLVRMQRLFESIFSA